MILVKWLNLAFFYQATTLINSQPKPKGVPVRLSAIDPNGNTVDYAK